MGVLFVPVQPDEPTQTRDHQASEQTLDPHRRISESFYMMHLF